MPRLSFAAMALLAMTGPAFAHAQLRDSRPAADSAGPAPAQITLDFSEGLEPRSSTVEVTDSTGMRVDSGDLHGVGSESRSVATGLKNLRPGVYTVVWHATAIDTHTTEGRFTFTVTTAAAKGISVEHPWARATSALQKVGGAFLTLSNSGEPDSLQSASSPDADRVELHETVDQGGVMKMLPVAELPVATGQTVALKPGSYHLMVMGLRHPLTPGSSFPLTLNFAKAGPVTVTVDVTTAGASGPNLDHGAMDHESPKMAPMPMPASKP